MPEISSNNFNYSLVITCQQAAASLAAWQGSKPRLKARPSLAALAECIPAQNFA
jgi:hypothetical protein